MNTISLWIGSITGGGAPVPSGASQLAADGSLTGYTAAGVPLDGRPRDDVLYLNGLVAQKMKSVVSEQEALRKAAVLAQAKAADGAAATPASARVLSKFEQHQREKTTGVTSHELAPEFMAVAQGNVVYHCRYKLPVIAFALAAAYMALQSLWHVGPACFLLIFLVSFINYDMYSGVLHIVLDHPGFVHLPLIGPGCLEFQWHHHIAHDITSKSFIEVCGDLNLAAGIMMALHLVGPLSVVGSPIGMSFMGLKILNAYFGQFSHRMSHMPASRRPAWVNQLQSMGLMISVEQHKQHHATYDNTYCIGSGICNPLMSWLINNVMASPVGWLAVWVVVSLVDINVLEYGVKALFSPQLKF